MSYTFNKIVEGSFDEVKGKVVEALKAEKFGVITEVNLSGTVKNKLDINMPRYEILGACSPMHAYNSVIADEDMGAFLPCNISLIEKSSGEVKVSVVNPIAYLQAVENKEVQKIASEIADAMKRVSASL